MLLIDNSIEGIIFESLNNGPIGTKILIDNVRKQRGSTTKQGVYLALRNLKKQEVVVIHNKQVSFNVRWLKNMENYFALAQRHYFDENIGQNNFLNLKGGEKITYSFNDTTQTDSFWWHALYLLSEAVEDLTEPAYLYNPHEWFFIARTESEIESLKTISKKRKYLVTASGNTVLDKYVAKYFDGKTSQYYMTGKQLFQKNNYYLNIVGDFLIEATIDPTVIKIIEDFYNRTTKVTEETHNELKRLVLIKSRSKLSISRNKKKAEKLKKIFQKYFV